ncbi:phosphoribosyltransferase family protein [Paenibacillus sp. F6_3S_P_1C]|uniref:Phosphoribosyltransferase family protein n=1 Tax=Paenibacillus vandeheii TaxID=3035917 RepID=A0ABT8JIW4_9BACL|nr:phosphoribosyltransferase family protein [Paenibacillus vandeheii]MDN4604897.1 phosphoribosyltransferase family protein [Paenibacillus vandeheii]
MNSSILSGSCPNTNKLTFPILDQFNVTIEATHNPLEIPLENLFSMAARLNKKRSFLFVSKLLGKHIAVNPYTSLLSGAALAVLLFEDLSHGEDKRISVWKQRMVSGLIDPDQAREAYEYLMNVEMPLPEEVKFVGFAETATALGHSMYELFAEHATYIHSTREYLLDIEPDIQFEEEHSHAMSHRCYALDSRSLAEGGPLVLVDDEITTGNTTLNIIRDIQRTYPRKQYYIASLLDWRTDADEQRFSALENELGITITPLSLLKGKIKVMGEPSINASTEKLVNEPTSLISVMSVAGELEPWAAVSADSEGNRWSTPYLRYTGRFGIHSGHNSVLGTGISRIAAILRGERKGQRTLVMGTGEFMHIPMRIAAEMGDGVMYQSTTRSPIHTANRPGYAVTAGEGYASPEDPTVRNYIYNVTPGQYDEIFVLMERLMSEERMQPMLDVLSQLGCKQIYVVYCGAPQED